MVSGVLRRRLLLHSGCKVLTYSRACQYVMQNCNVHLVDQYDLSSQAV